MEHETKAAFAEMRTEFAALRQLIADMQRGLIAHFERRLAEEHVETRRHFEIMVERMEGRIAISMDGYDYAREKIDRNKAECDANTAALDVRVTRLEAARGRRR